MPPEKGDEGRDLVALPVDLSWSEDPAAVGHRGDHSDGPQACGARAAECPAVDGDDLASRRWGLAFLEEVADGAVEAVTVHSGQDETDGRGVGRPDQAGQRIGTEPEQGQDALWRVGDPLSDRGERGGAGRTAAAAAVSRAAHGWRMPRRARGSGTAAR